VEHLNKKGYRFKCKRHVRGLELVMHRQGKLSTKAKVAEIADEAKTAAAAA